MYSKDNRIMYQNFCTIASLTRTLTSMFLRGSLGSAMVDGSPDTSCVPSPQRTTWRVGGVLGAVLVVPSHPNSTAPCSFPPRRQLCCRTGLRHSLPSVHLAAFRFYPSRPPSITDPSLSDFITSDRLHHTISEPGILPFTEKTLFDCLERDIIHTQVTADPSRRLSPETSSQPWCQ